GDFSFMTVADAGLSISATVGGTQANVFVSKGAALFTTVNEGGIQDLVAGDAFASGTIINGGGIELVGNGSIAAKTVATRGGTQIVDNSAQATDTLVSAGGAQVVEGPATGFSPGVASNTTLNGIQTVFGSSVQTTVNSGATEVVWLGGIASPDAAG